MYSFKSGEFDPVTEIFQMFDKSEGKKAKCLFEYFKWIQYYSVKFHQHEGMLCLSAEKHIHNKLHDISRDFITSYDELKAIKSGDLIKVVCSEFDHLGRHACRIANECQRQQDYIKSGTLPATITCYSFTTKSYVECQERFTFLQLNAPDHSDHPAYNCKVLSSTGVIQIPMFQICRV